MKYKDIKVGDIFRVINNDKTFSTTPFLINFVMETSAPYFEIGYILVGSHLGRLSLNKEDGVRWHRVATSYDRERNRMSRSVKKNAVHSFTTRGSRAGAQKKWKKGNNKKSRRDVNEITKLVSLLTEEGIDEVEDKLDLPLTRKKKTGDIWDSPCDGKTRVYQDEDYYEEALRK